MRQQLLLDIPPVFESGYLLPIPYFIIILSTSHPFLSSPERVIQEKMVCFVITIIQRPQLQFLLPC